MDSILARNVENLSILMSKQKFYDQMIGDVCFWFIKFEWYIFIVLFLTVAHKNVANDLIFTRHS